MADASKHYSDTALILLRANLGFYDSEIPAELETYLISRLNTAYIRLAEHGIPLTPGDLCDDDLQAMYAAWLYRKGGDGGAKPPMLQQFIRDRQIKNATADAKEGDT